MTVAATSQGDFPRGTESRMADFMELAGTAVANAQAEQKLRELVDMHSSLRRLAMLVARGEPPDAVFAAVTKEVLRHHGGDTARMIRFEPDGAATLLANEGTTGPHVRVGELWEGYPPTGLTSTVQRTGQPARVDDCHEIRGGEPFLREGLSSAVVMPVHATASCGGSSPEMVTNVAKHARASVVRVDVEAVGDTLQVRVNDDGIGGADPARGSGLVGLRDRLEALGEALSLQSPAGGGTTVSREIPRWPSVGSG